jgi:hypothetical protein
MKPLLPPKLVIICAAASGLLAMMVVALFAIGFVGLPFMLATLFVIAGGYCIAVFLGQQYKLAIEADQVKQLVSTLEATREQQSGIAIKYTALQENFQSLTDAATRGANESKEKYEAKLQSSEKDLQTKLSSELQKVEQREFEAKAIVRSIAIKYLDETKKTLISKLTPDNLTQTKDRFQKAVDFCRKVGFDTPKADIEQFQDDIKKEYADAVRKQLAREEQARIKEKLREEQKAEADFQREMKRLEAEEKLLERLLAEARAKATDESSAQIADLERRLAEAKDKERALSMAQQTKAGNVYVISNIGSFGDGVFKIGMTRRLEPMDRVKELGDASVPFPFDVHMMIACDNAPTMENELHKRFNKLRMNKINFRKEFFRVPLEEIHKAVEELHGEVVYTAEPEALQYRESIAMTDEQFEMVSELSEDLADDDDDGEQ